MAQKLQDKHVVDILYLLYQRYFHGLTKKLRFRTLHPIMASDRDIKELRRAMVAGSFYPAEPMALSKQLAELFSRARRLDFSGKVKAIVVPHAGYTYSGQVAAAAYKQLEGEQYDAVIVLAPFHGFFKGVSVYSGGGYETPLGIIPIDRQLSDAISNRHSNVFSSTVGHTGSGGRGEHSLEVQLPFLQMILGKFKLVAMVMGDQEESTIHGAAEALASALKGKNVLMVASSDMSHFHPEKEARRLDKVFEEALARFDAGQIIDVIGEGMAEACGFGPVAAVVEASQRLGGKEVAIVSYDTSGASTGDFSEVVGYLSAIITGDKEAVKPPVVSTHVEKKNTGYAKEEKLYLLNVARLVVEAKARGQKVNLPPVPSSHLEEKRGVFVTLTKRGELRGCIGLVHARYPLAEAVAEMAAAAAFEDPRFPKVNESELSDLAYEISVLTPLVRVDNLNDIIVGRDGLMIRLDLHSGLLLPQVAEEYGWDRTTFLEQTCLKAGLAKNTYKESQAQIYKFTVEKF